MKNIYNYLFYYVYRIFKSFDSSGFSPYAAVTVFSISIWMNLVTIYFLFFNPYLGYDINIRSKPVLYGIALPHILNFLIFIYGDKYLRLEKEISKKEVNYLAIFITVLYYLLTVLLFLGVVPFGNPEVIPLHRNDIIFTH